MASSNIKVIVTNAGIAAMLNAEKTGTEKITLNNCKFYRDYLNVSAETTATDLETLSLVADLDAVGGEQTSKNTIHVDAADSSANTYEVCTVGIFTSDGVLFAVTSSESSIIEKVAQSIAMFAADIIITNADASVLEFDNPSFTTAAATNTNAGVIRIATDGEAVSAIDGTIALVPSSLNALTANPAWRAYSDRLNYLPGALVLSEGKLYVCIANNGPASAIKDVSDSSAWQAVPNASDLAEMYLNKTDAGNTYLTKTSAAEIYLKKTEALPTGTIIPFAGSNIPNGYLLCNGSAVSRTSYANLFEVISTLYGEGDGSTTFNLPDLRDRFLEGAGTNVLGTYLEAGLPNITGRQSFYAGVDSANTDVGGAFIGCFTYSRGNKASFIEQTQNYADLTVLSNFSANSSNSMYKTGLTVQPKSLAIQYLIKY